MRRREFLALLAVASCAPQSHAHRSLVSLTRVTANARAGTWEFEHALHFHDAARVLRQLGAGGTRDAREALQPDTPRGQARLLLEIERSFLWLDPRGTPLALKAVGAELRADSLWIYQECAAPRLEGRYTVRCTLFHALDRSWRNSITLEVAGKTQTLRLSAEAPGASFENGG